MITGSTDSSSSTEAILSVLRSRVVTFAPGGVVGAGVYLQTGRLREAFLVCAFGPAVVRFGRVLARWVELLEPPRRWRRPRRRGS
jgi:hypothetical protein